MNVVAYMRVSTELQASIPQQLEAIRKYCEFNGLTLVGEFAESLSGATTDRPQFQAALATLGKTADGLVVYKLDRLSRKTSDWLQIVEDHFKEHTLHSVVERIDLKTAMGRAFFQIGGTFAQLERETTVERTIAGLRHRKEAGLKYCKRLFGYTGDKGCKLQTVPSEQKAIQTMTKLRKAGKSYQQIADYLNGSDVPPPSKGKWHKGTIQRICQRVS